MKAQLIIRVTQKDIKSGLRDNRLQCPIALALRRRYPGHLIVVDCETIEINDRVIDTPYRAERWMTAFDAGDNVKPTTFFLDAEV